MNRRSFLALAAATTIDPAIAQVLPRRAGLRVAFLSLRNPADGGPYRKAFRERLAERGFSADDVEVRYFDADWSIEVLAERARQIAAWAPDAVFAPGFDQAKAMQGATRMIPIVFCAVPDPVESGLVRELAQPGGNVTGAGFEYASLAAKRLELARELLPGASRVALLLRADPASEYLQVARQRLQLAAARLGLRLEEADVGFKERGLAATLETIAQRPPDAVLPFGTFERRGSMMSRNTLGVLLEFERRRRVPVINNDAVAVENGCLISLGPNSLDEMRTGVDTLARVLRGATPANTPVEMAVKYELVVNVSAARGMGIAIPQAVMIRADRVVN